MFRNAWVLGQFVDLAVRPSKIVSFLENPHGVAHDNEYLTNEHFCRESFDQILHSFDELNIEYLCMPKYTVRTITHD